MGYHKTRGYVYILVCGIWFVTVL